MPSVAQLVPSTAAAMASTCRSTFPAPALHLAPPLQRSPSGRSTAVIPGTQPPSPPTQEGAKENAAPGLPRVRAPLKHA